MRPTKPRHRRTSHKWSNLLGPPYEYFSCLASASIRATVERTARVKGQRRTECALAPPTSRMIFCCDDHLIVAVSAGTRSSSRRKGDSRQQSQNAEAAAGTVSTR